ncbi:hypothetical protein, partial [Mesorhizobium sp. M4B.F.Ca.ET.049.02.1.2]|uniref:hypothetical protein n=1 Tax=Mesorhizobium sp. M4B.F.Ca.ET.049.02.1.2 TaxID=2496752 RepID=UPI001AECA536
MSFLIPSGCRLTAAMRFMLVIQSLTAAHEERTFNSPLGFGTHLTIGLPAIHHSDFAASSPAAARRSPM